MTIRAKDNIGHGVQIGGLGSETGDLAGALYVTDNIPQSETISGLYGPETFELRPDLMDPSGGKGVHMSIYNDRLKSSAYTFEFRLHDHIAKRFFNMASRSSVFLKAPLKDGDSVIEVNDTSGFSTPAVVHIQTEAIYVDGTTTSNGNPALTIANRGVYGTASSRQKQGALLFNDIPSLENRPIRLFSYDVRAGSLHQRWMGIIKNSNVTNIKTAQNGTILKVPSSDPLSKIDDWVVNKERHSFDFKDGGLKYDHGRDLLRADSVSMTSTSPLETELHKRDDIPFNDTGFFKLEPGDDQTLKEPTLVRIAGGDDGTSLLPFITENVLGCPLEIGEKPKNLRNSAIALSGGQAKECMVVDPSLDAPANQQDPTNWSSSTWPLIKVNEDASGVGPADSEILDRLPYHPLAIDAAVLLSTDSEARDASRFDVFVGGWSIDLSWLFAGDGGQDAIDTAWEIINKTPQAAIDQLVIGWEDSPLTWMEWSNENLLSPNGIKRSLTQEGELTWSMRGIGDIEDYSAAITTPNIDPITKPEDKPGVLEWSPAAEKRVSAVRGDYDDLPWKEGSREVLSTSNKGDVGRNANSLDEDATIKLGVYRSVQKARVIVQERLELQSFADPMIRVEAQDPNLLSGSLSFDLGARVMLGQLPLDRAWLVDTDGDRITQINADPQWMAQIVGRYYNPSRMTYELDLFLANYADNVLGRQRAPSMIVHEKGTAGTSGTNWLFGPLSTTDTDYGGAKADVAHFHSNDEVALWTQNFSAQRSQTDPPYRVNQIQQSKTAPTGANRWAIELVDSSVTAADLSAVQTGDVVRLDSYSAYDSDFIAGVNRAFAYLASDNDKLGEGGSNETEADRFT